MAGSHRVRVTVMLVVASVMILLGLAAIVAFGLYQIQPPGATVQDLPDLPGLGLSGLGTTTRRIWPRAWRGRGSACWSWARSSSWSPGACARPTRAG